MPRLHSSRHERPTICNRSRQRLRNGQGGPNRPLAHWEEQKAERRGGTAEPSKTDWEIRYWKAGNPRHSETSYVPNAAKRRDFLGDRKFLGLPPRSRGWGSSSIPADSDDQRSQRARESIAISSGMRRDRSKLQDFD